MVKEFKFRGKTWDEIEKMSINEFAELVPARQRRSLKRDFTNQQKRLLEKIKKFKEGKYRRQIKTHCRDMIVVPEVIGTKIGIYNGKNFDQIEFTPEMLGHYFGEFVRTRKEVQHKAPGVGATRSSKHVSVK